jgi:uncharacterized protein
MIDNKMLKLKYILKSFDKILVAFSGGVDSSFLLKVCIDVLGSNNVLAVTAKTESFPEREISDAIKTANRFKAYHKIIDFDQLAIQEVSKNTPERCYFCKKALFAKLKDIASQEGIKYIVEGSNMDDIGDFRPGMKAMKELDIKSPLKDAGFKKSEIRKVACEMNIPTWDRPSFACLFSRFPYGEKVTHEKLKRVSGAEDVLRKMGLTQFRVRSHNDIARIEVLPEEIHVFFDEGFREKVVGALKHTGFNYVTLDLTGYRTGSMNEVLKEGEKHIWKS